MALLTRYVLIELIKVFAVALSTITALFMIFGVVSHAVRQDLGLMQIMQMLPFLVPEALRFAVPATILFATCSVYGRFSSSNEVVAVKSMGISPMVMLWPTYVFAFLLSLVSVWLNDVAVSWGREGVHRVILESIEEITYGVLRTKHSFSTSQFTINVDAVEGRKLINPVTMYRTPDGDMFSISAEEGELRSDPEKNELKIIWHNFTVRSQNGDSFSRPGSQEYVLNLDSALRKRASSGGPSELPMRVIGQHRDQEKKQIQHLEQIMAARATLQMVSGDFSALANSDWMAMQYQLEESYSRLNRLKMEPHRRWANGFSCLCFVFVGAPLAILMRRADFLSSFFACFLPILLVYYPLLLGGVDQVKSGALPPYSVWAGNALMFLWGLWLIKRVVRY